MKKIIGLIAVLFCSFSLQNIVIAQEAPHKIPDPKVVKENPAAKDMFFPKFMQFHKFCRPAIRMPRQVKNAFDLFKFADELKLTDEQFIQLRAFYKKYYSDEAKKREAITLHAPKDFYSMSDQELVKFADDEAERVRHQVMLKLQKIIDIRKILTKEQLDLLKNVAEKEAENERKKFEEKLLKDREAKKAKAAMPPAKHKKHHKGNAKKFFPRPGMMPPFMQPMCPPPFGMMQQPMQPMCPPPFGMMQQPMQPMCPPPFGMMQQPMQPMCPPPFGMMQQPMQPMCPPPFGMMPKHPMGPMGPQQGMMPKHPMGPMGPQQGMMPKHPMGPMGPQQGMMPQCPMGPMGPQQGMMPKHPMGPMGPQQGMMHQCPMGPMGPQQGMMPKHPMGPMGPQQGMMPQCPMGPMGPQQGMMPFHKGPKGCPSEMKPSKFDKKHHPKRPPYFDYLMKLFTCKNDSDSDIIIKEKEDKGSLKPSEKK